MFLKQYSMEESTHDSSQEHDPEQISKTSRRKFLRNLGLFGAGIAAGLAALESGRIFQKAKFKGKKEVLLTQDNKLVEVDSLEIRAMQKSPEEIFQLQGREGLPGHRWIWVIDLSKCRNARKCILACQEAHHLQPDQFHINTLEMQENAAIHRLSICPSHASIATILPGCRMPGGRHL